MIVAGVCLWFNELFSGYLFSYFLKKSISKILHRKLFPVQKGGFHETACPKEVPACIVGMVIVAVCGLMRYLVVYRASNARYGKEPVPELCLYLGHSFRLWRLPCPLSDPGSTTFTSGHTT